MRSQPTPSFNSQSIAHASKAAIASRPSTAGCATGLPSHRPRDPLHRAGRYPELSRDLVKAGSAKSRQSLTDSLFCLSRHSGAPEGFAALRLAFLASALAFIEFCVLTDPPYVARSHTGALKCASSHFGDSFGKLALVHGNPFANQFDGFCLIWFICQVISDDPSVSLGVERRHPDIPSCWHSDAADRPSCPSRC
jgi:hypothetical protein